MSLGYIRTWSFKQWLGANNHHTNNLDDVVGTEWTKELVAGG